ncbi:MAG: DUF2062 domain-containing protein [Chitinophagaceae bacterium]|nr:DUF2062 domain-containing protein [Chitinophagaceae bacterium]MCW5927352.1 DUF2062 domain-containing protein [Chitinophagaceae bacterium]
MIPTYNNAATLGTVIDDVRRYTRNIIVVNDGSTDETEHILTGIEGIIRVSYPVNRGKGWALRTGFQKAVVLGFRYAITIDSDGQHFAKDLPVFLQKIKEVPDAIIIGSRNMDQESVPAKSSFGNKFSSFWFRLETGIKMPDTQSGYRLYPVKKLEGIRFFSLKYEFEIEVLVRAAWKGIPVVNVPVSVYYAPPEERVSHFRPFKDFFRISILNTILVLAALLYIYPRNFLRSVFQKEARNNFFRNHILSMHEPNHTKVFSVALGVFMGIVPIWGFQLVTAIFLSVLLKLNKALVILAANISIPPMIPLIIYLSYQTGTLWMSDSKNDLLFTKELSFEAMKDNFQQYVYGSITLAVLAAILFGFVTWILLLIFRKKPNTIPQ